MKNFFFIILAFIYNLKQVLASTASSEIKDKLLDGVRASQSVVQLGEGKEGLTNVFIYIKDTIFGLLALIVIGTFLFIGYKIIISRGNPEEFKKAFMMLIYAIIGLLVVSLAWVIIMFISGLNV